MTMLLMGLALWWGAHLLKRMAPEARARLGTSGRGVLAGLLVASVALMVLGFRAAEVVPVWDPPRFLTHVNNLLVIAGLYLFAADGARAKLALRVRNPQLTAFKAWAVGHLLVNGDLASILLFGGLLAWAVVSVIVLKRTGVTPKPRPWGGPKAEVIAVLATAVSLAVIAAVHTWLGYWPFG